MAYKLLLADDSITIQKVVELTLSEEGFDVTAVGDGEAALEAAGKIIPDVILADVFMPKMDGYELCEKVRADDRFSGTPVMLLSGTFEEFDEIRAARVGASGNLTKPFESSELISRVRQLVENRPAASAPATPQAPQPVAAAVVEEAAAESVDDLWSVVDMGSEDQPLAGATEILEEEDLWKRANLVGDDEPEAVEAEPVVEMAAEPVEEAEEVFDAYEAVEVEEAEPVDDKTAVLNMDDVRASIYSQPEAEPVSPEPIDVAEVTEAQEITSFETLDAATEADEYIPPPPPVSAPAQPAPAAAPQISAEDMDAKIREAISKMTADMIEKIVWEVVPELAEEIINREIEKIRSGRG